MALHRYRIKYKRTLAAMEMDQFVSFGVTASTIEEAITAIENNYELNKMNLSGYEILHDIEQEITVLGGSIIPIRRY